MSTRSLAILAAVGIGAYLLFRKQTPTPVAPSTYPTAYSPLQPSYVPVPVNQQTLGGFSAGGLTSQNLNQQGTANAWTFLGQLAQASPQLVQSFSNLGYGQAYDGGGFYGEGDAGALSPYETTYEWV